MKLKMILFFGLVFVSHFAHAVSAESVRANQVMELSVRAGLDVSRLQIRGPFIANPEVPSADSGAVDELVISYEVSDAITDCKISLVYGHYPWGLREKGAILDSAVKVLDKVIACSAIP